MAADADLQARLRALPPVDRILAELSDEPRGPATAAARRAVDSAREEIRAGGGAPSLEEIVASARSFLEERERSLLRPVFNATGVLIHTNLGRVPLGEEQLAAVTAIASTYSNLELDLDAGERGSRHAHASGLLTELTGAEAALVVNNNAAAVLLTLSALCAGREVIISRGELVEIGGEFRIPDVVASSGVKMVEVGTTNRTHIGDYERAVSPETAAILKVHPSNYRVVGFTATVRPRDVARLARGRGIPFVHDLGSGLVMEDEGRWAEEEPSVRHALEDGADVVTFSGDKLFGGPQAGVVAGRRDLIERIARHPLMRALRPDKMTLAALQSTLRMYIEGRGGELPVWRMAHAPLNVLRQRSERMALALEQSVGRGIKVEAVPLRAVPGGGSLPGTEIDSYGVWIEDGERSTAELQRTLRRAETPVLGRIEDDRLVLDLRTVPPSEDDALLDLLVRTLETRLI